MTSTPTFRTRLIVVALALISLQGLGCATTPPIYEDPIPVMLNRDRDERQRLAAMAQARERFPDDPRRIRALHKLVWDRGHPGPLRNQAIDDLVAYDERAFLDVLPRRLTLIQNWNTLDHLWEVGMQRQWPELTAIVVRSYARPAHGVADEDRPERDILLKLHPGKSIDQIVYDVFADADNSVPISEQVAAWSLLNRIADRQMLLAYVRQAPVNTALMADLKAAADDLAALPRNAEEILWLQHLRQPRHAQLWADMKARVATLTPQQQRGLAVRHLPVLLHLDSRTFSMSRDQLARAIETRLDGAEHHLIGPTYDGPMRDWPQRFAKARDQLVWADLATIQLLMGIMQDADAARALFKHADADHEDDATEFGGVVDIRGGRFTITPYPPITRKHDYKFIPSAQMFEHLYTAVAHYHFHAQEKHNRDHAGPGRGDQLMANRTGITGLVLTFIDENRLNMDYYQPGRLVVDLGTIRRP